MNHSQVIEKVSPAKKSAITRAEKTSLTRNTIAIAFILSYIFLVFFLIILSTFYNLAEETVKDYLLAIGAPLGFIVGYYFKTTGKD